MTYLEDDKLNEYLIKAISFHVALVAFIFLLNTLFSLKLFDFKSDKKIEVIQASVRIDVVELPKMTLQELKKINLNTETVEETITKKSKSNETSEIEFKKKAKKVNLNNLLKNLSHKKVKRKIIKKKKSILAKEALNKLILEGNKISKGASTTGVDINQGQQEYVDYIQRLPDQIRPFWKLPSYLLERELRCRIRLFIGSNGHILRSEIFESSGEAEYDKKALLAVKKSSPLPKPSSSILRRVTNGDVILGFPL